MALTPNQERFCHLYVKTNNATRSYIDAGYANLNYNACGVSAHQLLKKPKVKEFIDRLRQEIVDEMNISKNTLIIENAKAAFASMDDVAEVDSEGRIVLKPGCSLDSIESSSGSDSFSSSNSDKGDSLSKSKSFSIKKVDRLKALDNLAKMIGAYEKNDEDNSRDLEHTSRRVLEALSKVRGRK